MGRVRAAHFVALHAFVGSISLSLPVCELFQSSYRSEYLVH